jgi:hypothetical protein
MGLGHQNGDAESGKTALGPIKIWHENGNALICSPDTTKIAMGRFKYWGLKAQPGLARLS